MPAVISGPNLKLCNILVTPYLIKNVIIDYNSYKTSVRNVVFFLNSVSVLLAQLEIFRQLYLIELLRFLACFVLL